VLRLPATGEAGPLDEVHSKQQYHIRDPDRSSMSGGTAGLKDQRRLAAIFAADAEDYSRLMGSDEVGTLRTLTAHREIMDRLIGEHGGRIANTAGDSVLAEFPSKRSARSESAMARARVLL
jgi:class 3 adenylate cyclase